MAQYATIAEADTYFAGHVFADMWTQTPRSERDKPLIHATRLIDRLNFSGDKAVATQDLEFPRGDDTVIPDAIKYATFEIALALVSGRDPEVEVIGIGDTVVSYGKIRTTVDPSYVDIARRHNIPSIVAWSFLLPYLRDSGRIKLHRIN